MRAVGGRAPGGDTASVDAGTGRVCLNMVKQLTHLELSGYPIYELCKLTEEYWGASVGGSKDQPANFIHVPQNALALSNEELGKRVRAYEILIEEAAARRIVETVNYGGVDDRSLEELTGWQQTLSAFSSRASHKEALAIVDRRVQYLTMLPARRQHTKDQRQVVKSNYNELFMRLGREHGFKCASCGDCHGLEIDHVVPLANGGTSDYDNLQLICKTHNMAKGTETIDYRQVR